MTLILNLLLEKLCRQLFGNNLYLFWKERYYWEGHIHHKTQCTIIDCDKHLHTQSCSNFILSTSCRKWKWIKKRDTYRTDLIRFSSSYNYKDTPNIETTSSIRTCFYTPDTCTLPSRVILPRNKTQQIKDNIEGKDTGRYLWHKVTVRIQLDALLPHDVTYYFSSEDAAVAMP